MASTTTLSPVLKTLIAEYEATEGDLSLHARHRREAAQDAVTAAYFYALDREIDPDRMDILAPEWVEELMEYSNLVSVSLVLAMLDYRQRASAAGLTRDEASGLLLNLLTQICDMSVQEFWGEAEGVPAAA